MSRQAKIATNIRKPAKKRGKVSWLEWQSYTRYVLRHLSDPGDLQGSPFCQFAHVAELASRKYSENTIPGGLALKAVVTECLRELEDELDGHTGAAKLKEFIRLTREGHGVADASRAIRVNPAYGCRVFKRQIVERLTKKLLMKCR